MMLRGDYTAFIIISKNASRDHTGNLSPESLDGIYPPSPSQSFACSRSGTYVSVT